MKKRNYIFCLVVTILFSACTSNSVKTGTKNTLKPISTADQVNATPTSTQQINSNTQKAPLMKKADIKTSLGNIVIEFYPEDAPQTVTNFQKLASNGFYKNITFHRVIKNFMIQCGDPTGTGRGGPGYQFEDEINPDSALYKSGYKKGIVAMANAGPNTNGSQFFIMHSDYSLPPNYTIFGHVTVGQDVVDKIASVETDENDKPKTPVTIESVTLSN